MPDQIYQAWSPEGRDLPRDAFDNVDPEGVFKTLMRFAGVDSETYDGRSLVDLLQLVRVKLDNPVPIIENAEQSDIDVISG